MRHRTHSTSVAAFCPALLVGVALLTPVGRLALAENLLANPSFEIAGEAGVPASWARECAPKLSGPFMVGRDA